MKRRIAVISGWFGKGQGSEYRANRDGTSDYLLAIFDKLSVQADLVLDIEEIKETKSSFDCEFHLNVQIPVTQAPMFCYLLETPEIRPQNLFHRFVPYKRVYSFKRESPPLPSYVWTPYPHGFKGGPVDGFSGRDILFSMIASNRNVLFNGEKSLYTERQKIIDFFCRYHPSEMQLFGAGWDNRFSRPGVFSRAISEMDKRLKRSKTRIFNEVWQGIAESKHPILRRTRFNFCYENMNGIPGYVSEKIYDSAANGAIPIYIPASDENDDLVPKELYIDPRDFESFHSLRAHCLSIDAQTFSTWQHSLFDFCASRGEFLQPDKRAEWLVSDFLSNC